MTAQDSFMPGVTDLKASSPSPGIDPIMGLVNSPDYTFGPFRDYTIVTSDFGEHAVKGGLIMMFQQRNVFDKKELAWDLVAFPLYFKPQLDKKGKYVRDEDTGQILLDHELMGSGVEFENYKRPKPRTTAGL